MMVWNNVTKSGVAMSMAISSITVMSPAHAEVPPLHRVTYTVTALNPSEADIYYRDIDPPNWAEYSHNPYQFSPKVEAQVGPGKTWVLEVTLADPDRWAMVAATSGPSPATPRFRCDLAVDGTVVKSGEGPKGALCSLRQW